MNAEPIKVLVVDDSSLVRRIVTGVLASTDGVETAGQAANGIEALERLKRGDIDVIVLDLEMPEMDGLTALVQVRKDDPSLPVIVLSQYTTRGAKSTLDALAAGASDYLTKPSGMNDPSAARAYLRDELIPRVLALGARRRQMSTLVVEPRKFTERPPAQTLAAPAILAIGSSTGGPAVVSDLLIGLGGNFPLPILLSQHMPKRFTPLFAERLDRLAPFSVREAVNGESIEPGAVYVSPGDAHLLVTQESTPRISLSHEPPINSCRPSVDVLFTSVANAFGASALAVVLTGMGRDGFSGSQQIRSHDGSVVVQDEASSVVWGMPGAVANAGLADAVLPVEPMAQYLRRWAASGIRAPR